MTTPSQRLTSWLSRSWRWLGPLLVVVLAAALFGSLLASNVYADPDGFYHVKVAELIRDHGPIRDFPWLPFTSLADHFVDQHFLYHVLLIPFVSVLPPLIGGKVATVVFGSAFALTFYLLLHSLRVRGAFAVTVLLLTVNPFIFRLSLVKVPAVSLLLLLLILAALFHYRPRWLAVLAFLYPWFYGGAVLGLVVTGTFVAVSLVRHVWLTRQAGQHSLARFFHLPEEHHWQARRRLLWHLALAAVLGFVGGTVINPSFPRNLWFLFDQLVRIGIVNYRDTIGVGGEWYPYPLGELLPNTVALTILLVVAVVLAAANVRKLTVRSWTLIILTTFFLLLTLKSRRYIEYYVPVGMLTAAVMLKDALAGVDLRATWHRVVLWSLRSTGHLTAALLLALYLVTAVATIAVRDYATEHADLRRGFRQDQYQGAMTWLSENAPVGALVFHSDWDEFPLLFYFDDRQRYIAGLDPTFFYTADPERYWSWVAVTTGKEQAPVGPLLRDTFGADYVFVDADHTVMDALFRSNTDFRLQYEDTDAKVYARQR